MKRPSNANPGKPASPTPFLVPFCVAMTNKLPIGLSSFRQSRNQNRRDNKTNQSSSITLTRRASPREDFRNHVTRPPCGPSAASAPKKPSQIPDSAQGTHALAQAQQKQNTCPRLVASLHCRPPTRASRLRLVQARTTLHGTPRPRGPLPLQPRRSTPSNLLPIHGYPLPHRYPL